MRVHYQHESALAVGTTYLLTLTILQYASAKSFQLKIHKHAESKVAIIESNLHIIIYTINQILQRNALHLISSFCLISLHKQQPD